MHNYFIIRAGGGEWRAENAVSPDFPALFLAGGYLSRVSLSAGGKTWLAPARRSACCFDPDAVPFARFTAEFSDPALDGIAVSGAGLAGEDGACVDFAAFGGIPAKRPGEPLAVECTVYFTVSAPGVRLLGGDNPLLRWLAGENRDAEISFCPLVRPGAVEKAGELPAGRLIPASRADADGEAVFSAAGLSGGAGAALAVDGVAALVYETAESETAGRTVEIRSPSDVFVPEFESYDAELLSVRAADGGVSSLAGAWKRRYGLSAAAGREIASTVRPDSPDRVTGAERAFAVYAGARLELFCGGALPAVLDEGREISCAALGGNDYLAVAFADGDVRLFSVTSGALADTGLVCEAPGARRIAVAADGTKILVATAGGRVREIAVSGGACSVTDSDGTAPAELEQRGLTALRLSGGVLSEYVYDGGEKRMRSVAADAGEDAALFAVPGGALVRRADGSSLLVDLASGRTFAFSAADGEVTLSRNGAYLLMRSPYGRAKLFHWNWQDMRPEYVPLLVPAQQPAYPVPGGLLSSGGSGAKLARIYEDRAEFVLTSAAAGERTAEVREIQKRMADSLAIGVRAVI